MTHQDLQAAVRRQPFHPFRMILSTGAVYEIPHPDLIMVGRRSAVIGIPNQLDTTVYERTLMVDLFHVVGIENADSPPTANGPTP